MRALQVLTVVTLLLHGCSSEHPERYSELLSETTSPTGFRASVLIQSNWDGFRRTYVFVHSPDGVCGYTAVVTDNEVKNISLEWIDGFNLQIQVPDSIPFETIGDNEGFPCTDMDKISFTLKTVKGEA